VLIPGDLRADDFGQNAVKRGSRPQVLILQEIDRWKVGQLASLKVGKNLLKLKNTLDGIPVFSQKSAEGVEG
jgi:hypothetical protein